MLKFISQETDRTLWINPEQIEAVFGDEDGTTLAMVSCAIYYVKEHVDEVTERLGTWRSSRS